MSASLHRISSILFYSLGTLVLVGLLLVRRGVMLDGLYPILNSLDLPLIGAAMVYGGTSLYRSLTRSGKTSMPLAMVISIPLLLLFTFFVYANFFLPFAEAL